MIVRNDNTEDNQYRIGAFVGDPSRIIATEPLLADS